MDLNLSPEDVAFRDMIRAEIPSMVPEDIKASVENLRHLGKEDYLRWQSILYERGWATPSWPVEFGGPGWSPMQRVLFEEECYRAGAPRPNPHINMIGPVLQTFGTDEQKHRYLPGIPTLKDWWCQGYSEPGSGSDLASLRTKAVRDGDQYIINGQKIWTTWAHWADFMFCLVRTSDSGRPQEGITFLLLRMDTPGITIRPIHSLDGAHDVNEVFFEDVAVPVENVVLGENRGWTVAKFLLNAERTEIAGLGQSKRLLRLAKQLALRLSDGGASQARIDAFRAKIASLSIDLRAHEWTLMRVSAAVPGDPRAPSASILKLCGTDLLERLSALVMDMSGPVAMTYDDDARNRRTENTPPYGHMLNGTSATYLEYRKSGLVGGTTEIQKTLIYRESVSRWSA